VLFNQKEEFIPKILKNIVLLEGNVAIMSKKEGQRSLPTGIKVKQMSF
jgi:hypothetical protein